jgi:DNA-binding IclR family transcriptional regulator
VSDEDGGPRPASGERRGTIQSVERASRILKALGTGSSRMGVTEIAERLGLAKGTAYGLLRTLEAQELVEQDPETDKYHLGPAMLQLGNAFLDNHELRARSLLWADSLASRVGEAVRVGVLHGSNVLIVHHVFRPDNSVQILEVGASIPWHACALGKAIVAFLPEPSRRALLEAELSPLTGRTVTDPAVLEGALAAVVRDGSALEDQEAIVGEAEVAAPVFDDLGHSVGAIGVVGPVERLVPEGHPASAVVAAVRETSRGLSRDMGAGRVRARGGAGRR